MGLTKSLLKVGHDSDAFRHTQLNQRGFPHLQGLFKSCFARIDLLTRIRNAKDAKHKYVDVRCSKLNKNIVAVLQDKGLSSLPKLVKQFKKIKNRLIQAGETFYEYDSTGNLTQNILEISEKNSVLASICFKTQRGGSHDRYSRSLESLGSRRS